MAQKKTPDLHMEGAEVKTTRWAFTAYEGQWSLFDVMPPSVNKWGWQTEICPDTGREHWQGYMQLKQQQRFSWMRKNFPGLHVSVAKNWDALVNYCKKEPTRKEGTEPVEYVNDIPSKFAYAEEVAKRLPVLLLGIDPTTEEILDAVQVIVRTDIRAGRRGIEWIASNPDWKVVWKSYGPDMYIRGSRQPDRQAETPPANEIISPQ